MLANEAAGAWLFGDAVLAIAVSLASDNFRLRKRATRAHASSADIAVMSMSNSRELGTRERTSALCAE